MQIDIPKELAVCVKRIGGIVFDETLKAPNFANADYWFPNANVVAELKCLTEDLTTKQEFIESITNMHASWVRRGLVPPPTQKRTQLNLRDLPPRCAREFLDPIKKRLEASTVKKANRQIRDTKKYLSAPTAKGLLILVNDGNYMLPPNVLVSLVGHILKGQYSSIDSVLCFSANMNTKIPGILMPTRFWVEANPPERTPISAEFLSQLRETWIERFSELTPGPIFEIQGSKDPNYFDNLQFIK